MSDQQLMQQNSLKEFKYSEEWEIYMSNQVEPYILNEVEYEVFKQMLLSGMKGIINFEKFIINTSFFVSSFQRSRFTKPIPKYYREIMKEDKVIGYEESV